MTAWETGVKRCFDIVLSGTGLIALGWLILLAWIIASVDCRASGLFRQERVGRHGRVFKIMKIRTMRENPAISTTVTTSRDPRITRLGRFFRRYKIDELPQLINVFVGDMSFVGPRPDVRGFADELEADGRRILSVRPGITGPATLYFRDEERILQDCDDPEAYNRQVVYPKKVELNLEYVDNYSLAYDIEIIWRTIFNR